MPPYPRRPQILLAFVILAALTLAWRLTRTPSPIAAQAHHQVDIVYGRKHGMALTMDVFTPRGKPNGAAVIWLVSGGWYSAHEYVEGAIPLSPVNQLLERGYTVFAVVHSSQPRFNIPEILGDIHRSVRYIRYNAARFGIDPQRIGITGASSGGHLSLMQATAGNGGDPMAADPVDRTSSRVQAVACFFPPTDFLNYGKPGDIAWGSGLLRDFKGPFAFRQPDPRPGMRGLFIPVTNPRKVREIAAAISPINWVTPHDPPTFIIHGDRDALVPLQQSRIMIAKLKAAKVPAQLVIKKGAAHGWDDLQSDMPKIVDWFDKYLPKK